MLDLLLDAQMVNVLSRLREIVRVQLVAPEIHWQRMKKISDSKKVWVFDFALLVKSYT